MATSTADLAGRRAFWLREAAKSCSDFARQLAVGVERVERHYQDGALTGETRIHHVDSGGALAALRLAADFLAESDKLAEIVTVDSLAAVVIHYEGPEFTAPSLQADSTSPLDLGG